MDSFSFTRDRLKFLLKRHAPESSYRQISIHIGCKDNYISNLLKADATDHSKGGPRLLPMLRLCDYLGISMDELVGRPNSVAAGPSSSEVDAAARVVNARTNSLMQAGNAPSIQGMLFRHHKSGGDINAFEEFMEFFDLYVAPKSPDGDIEAVHVGKLSMAGITMGEANPEKLSRALNHSSETLKAKLIQDHLNCMKNGPISTIESLDHKMENMPVKVKMDYMRLIAHVIDTDGTGYILTYAVPLF